MSNDEETFSIALVLQDVEVIGFRMKARSTNVKRWIYFSMLMLVLLAWLVMMLAPYLERLI